MAGQRRGKQQNSRRFEIDDLLSVIEAMNSIRNGHAQDPTSNVKESIELRAAHEKEIRKINEKWQDKFDAAKDRAVAAEAGRIDALRAGDAASFAQALQTAATAALALQNQVSTSALTLAETARLNKDTTDRAIAALQLAQAQGSGVLGGRETQRAEELGQSQFALTRRDRSSQWIIGIAITGGLGILGLSLSVGIFIATHVKFT